MEELLTIGQFSRRSGVAVSALRYYEERGLISSVRTSSSHRQFARSTLRRVAFIVFAQRIGLSLDEIRAELDKLPTGHTPDGEDWAKLSGTWTERIDERMAELKRLKVGLTKCISCGCLSLESCALANPSDRASHLGPGPRYWVGGRAPVKGQTRDENRV